jgi:hypothetical protein
MPQPQTLPFSGVPQPMQIPNQAPQAPIPAPQPPQQAPAPAVQIQQQPYDQAASEATAIAREQALRQTAEQQFPEQNPASILSTLAGIAGNIAGAITHKGDVGNAGVEYGDKLRQESGQQQRQYMARVLEAEQKYKQEQKDLTDLQNKKLRADSLAPLISRLPDAQMKAALYGQLAAGDVDGAQAAYHQAQEMQRQREMDVFNRKLKLDQTELANAKFDLRQQQTELDAKLKEINYAQKVRNYAEQPEKEQRKIIEKDSKEYKQYTQKYISPVSDFVSIVQKLGDLDSPEAKEKLNRLLGATGSARAQYFGTKEDKELYQTMVRLHGIMKTPDFGTSLTNNEQALLKSFTGLDISGKLLGNLGRNADNVVAGLKDVQRVLESRLNTGASGLHPKAIEGFEKPGQYVTPRAFAQAIQDARAIGGKNLDATPPGVDANVWSRLNRAQRTEFYKQVQGVGNAQ